MTPHDFCYWLQGFVEIGGPKEISPEQVQVIKDHLALVFSKQTPNRSLAQSFQGGITQGLAQLPQCSLSSGQLQQGPILVC